MPQSEFEKRLELVLKDLARVEDAVYDAATQSKAAFDYVSATYATVEDILADINEQNDRAN